MPSLLDRFGLGGARATANARHEMLRHQREDRLVAELLDALARHDARTDDALADDDASRAGAMRPAA